MKTFFLTIVFLALNANASFPFLGFQNKMKNPNQKLDCTDFSGSWVGICVSTDGSGQYNTPAEMEISMNNCSTMYMDSHNLPIDGIKTEASSNKFYSSSSILNLSWNDSVKKEFITYLVNDFYKDFQGKVPAQYAAQGSGNMKINGNRLMMEGITKNEGGKTYSMKCDYSKKHP